MSGWVFLILWCAACGFARRWQGVAKETWPIKRTYRMAVLWLPLAAVFAALAWWQGSPAWTWPLGLLPGAWSWMPGKYNSFLVWNLTGRKINTVWAEGIQGGLGGLIAGGLLCASLF